MVFVRHCVLLKLKDDTPLEKIEDVVAGIKSLQASLPNILRLRCGIQVEAIGDRRTSTVAAVVDFPDEAAYKVRWMFESIN